MKIALDAMGGDYAPATTVEGAIEALDWLEDLSVVLVGNESGISAELARRNYSGRNFHIVNGERFVKFPVFLT